MLMKLRHPGGKWTVIRRVFRRVMDHECGEIAGEMAFDFTFSIFLFLLRYPPRL